MLLPRGVPLDHRTTSGSFAKLHSALRPGGRRRRPCGGRQPRDVSRVGSARGTWLYATPEDTERRLRDAGSQAAAWLSQGRPRGRHGVSWRPVVLHGDPTPARLAERAPQLDHLDYVRLNMEATA
jgi:hypothetical protein